MKNLRFAGGGISSPSSLPLLIRSRPPSLGPVALGSASNPL
ncbi:MAG: hypothetical protein ABIH68_00885 [bacterium]